MQAHPVGKQGPSNSPLPVGLQGKGSSSSWKSEPSQGWRQRSTAGIHDFGKCGKIIVSLRMDTAKGLLDKLNLHSAFL